MIQSSKRFALFLVSAFLVILPDTNISVAQDMEPRAYSNAPIGTNFVGMGYAYSSGDVSIDPAIPITNVEAKIHNGSLGYSRFFGLADRTASFAIVLPYFDGDLSGEVSEEQRKINRTGLGDMRFRLAVNVLGGPALTPEQFANRVPTTTIGLSMAVVAPTGEYTSQRLVNIGANRWAFKPEVGISQPIGDWFIEGAAGLWIYSDNNNSFGGHDRSQDPIGSFQLHIGYNFYPGLWLAADGSYWVGGETSIDDGPKKDLQSNSRFGATLSAPLSKSFSIKLGWSNGLTTRTGGDFDTVLVAAQYRWFDG